MTSDENAKKENVQKIEKVKNALNTFINAADNSDVKLLETVIHDNYINTQYGFFGKPGVYNIGKNQYLDYIKDKTFGGLPRSINIIDSKIFDNTAMMEVVLESKALIFHSYIHIILDNDKWQVIGNYPNVVAKL
ncbi:nuclear transport factor 2 family protein [Tenacibaculum sp. 190524A05c]|uniref:nuclear transport factor 2 family protein n=1 Tax=Tenacibaculum platacis TaxID=3137852 RepID=UPI0032B0FDDA